MSEESYRKVSSPQYPCIDFSMKKKGLIYFFDFCGRSQSGVPACTAAVVGVSKARKPDGIHYLWADKQIGINYF